jgi:hypothetical protein
MYDSEWARGVVAAFRIKHGSGASVVDRLYHLPSEYCERLLLGNDIRWRGYKALCKHLEDSMELYEKGYRHSRDSGSNYYTFDKYLKRVLQRRPFPAALDLLDGEISSDYSGGAPNREDGPTEVTREGRQFLFEFSGA